MWCARAVVMLLLVTCVPSGAGAADETARWPALESGPIEDNSFLIEEAYNQEAGVVQHLVLGFHDAETEEWRLSFTQEWPLFGQAHQLSYTVPFAVAGREGETGPGDVLLSYRYQLLDDDRLGLALAPRSSLVLPTGEPTEELGDGSLGVELALPASQRLGAVTVHANVGGRILPDARAVEGPPSRRLIASVAGGASAIWQVADAVNLLCEVLAIREEENTGSGVDARLQTFISPGVRVGWNIPGGVQLVGGVALPLGVTRETPDLGLLLYLSIEHAVTAAARAERNW